MKNWVDVVIVLLGVFAVWRGYLRGFLRESLEIVGIVLAFVAASRYSSEVAVFFTDTWSMPQNLSIVISYALILTAVAILTQIVLYFASPFTTRGVLGILDSSMGGFFSLIKIFLILIIILNLSVMGPLQFLKDPVSKSHMAKYLLSITPDLYDFMVQSFPENWGEKLELYREQFLTPDESEPIRRI